MLCENTTTDMKKMVSGTSLAENLLPTLVQCFGTIFIGYIFGQLKILPNAKANGLCIFLQYLSLPSLIFISLATISFTSVRWQFVASILVSKAVIFITVVFITMLLTKPIHLGKSGIYAIAATQSNDLALGYPFMLSLYKICNKDFPTILYLVVPIQLLILNPVGFFLMETYKRMSEPLYSQQCKILIIMKGILRNPVIMMTILGLIWNVVFSHYNMPLTIVQLLKSLASVFSPVALFVLGHSMSREGNATRCKSFLTPALIVLMKNLVLPLLLQKITLYLFNDNSEFNTQHLSSFGFLYGTIPTAPSVFVFAKHYEIAVEVITSTTICSTLLSAPLMFLSGTLISLTQNGVHNFNYYLKQVASYTGAVNLVCSILLCAIFIRRRYWHNICHIGIIYIVIAQVISSLSAILLFFYVGENLPIFHAGYILQTAGLFLTYMSGTFLALLIYLTQWQSLRFILRHHLQIRILGFIVPMAASIILSLCLIDTKNGISGEGFRISQAQNITTMAVAIICFTAIAFFLLSGHRCITKRTNTTRMKKNLSSEENSETVSETDTLIKHRSLEDYGLLHDNLKELHSKSGGSDDSDDDDINNLTEQISSDSNLYSCTSNCVCIQQHVTVSTNDESYQNEFLNYDSCTFVFDQYKKCMSLLLCICCSMMINITECLSKLLSDTSSASYVEIQFLNAILKNGHGILCFFLYGPVWQILTIIYLKLQNYCR